MPRTRQAAAPLNQELDRLEALPQPVVAYGRDLAAGEVLAAHRHRRAQLVYASSGVMTVTTPSAAYVVPPQRAVWMPGGVEHRIDARSDVAMRTLYVEVDETANLPKEVCVLQVTPLLRELVIAAVAARRRSPRGCRRQCVERWSLTARKRDRRAIMNWISANAVLVEACGSAWVLRVIRKG